MLYRLPELLERPEGAVVYIPEGEKHCDRLAALGLTAITTEVNTFTPDLIVIDALATFAVGLVEDSHHDSQWTPLLVALTAIARRLHCAIVIVHHLTKTTGEYRDSTAIGAAVDYILTMTAIPPGSTSRHVAVLGRRSFPDYTVRLEDNAFTTEAAPPPLEIQALTFIRSHPRTSQQAVVDHLGVRAEDARHAIRTLENQGHIEDHPDPNGRHHYSIAGLEPELPLEEVTRPEGSAGTGRDECGTSDGTSDHSSGVSRCGTASDECGTGDGTSGS